jgi:hypothetical protein
MDITITHGQNTVLNMAVTILFGSEVAAEKIVPTETYNKK